MLSLTNMKSVLPATGKATGVGQILSSIKQQQQQKQKSKAIKPLISKAIAQSEYIWKFAVGQLGD